MFKGQLLKSERLRAKFSQVQLADGICTSIMISQIENDKAKPSDQLQERLAEKLQVSVSDFRGE